MASIRLTPTIGGRNHEWVAKAEKKPLTISSLSSTVNGEERRNSTLTLPFSTNPPAVD